MLFEMMVTTHGLRVIVMQKQRIAGFRIGDACGKGALCETKKSPSMANRASGLRSVPTRVDLASCRSSFAAFCSELATAACAAPDSLRPWFGLAHAVRYRKFLSANESNSHYRGTPRRTRLTIASRITAPRNETSKLAVLKLL